MKSAGYIKLNIEEFEKAIKESVLKIYLCDKDTGEPIMDVRKFLKLVRNNIEQ